MFVGRVGPVPARGAKPRPRRPVFGAGPVRDHVDVTARSGRSLPRSGQFHVSAAPAVSPPS